MSATNPRSGNVLIIILIAVVLFAALARAVLSTSRAPGSIGDEDARLIAASLLDYGAQVKSGYDRIMINNGVAAWYVDTCNQVWRRTGGGLIENCPGSVPTKLKLFNPAGGDVQAMVFPKASIGVANGTADVDWLPGHAALRWANVPGQGTDDSDLVLKIARINDKVCKIINGRAGIGSVLIGGHINTVLGLAYGQEPSILPSQTGWPYTLVSGKPFFCMSNELVYLLVIR